MEPYPEEEMISYKGMIKKGFNDKGMVLIRNGVSSHKSSIK